MSDDNMSMSGEEGMSSQQAPAKRLCHMGVADPNHLTQFPAVAAVHAEPAGSSTHSYQTAPAVTRCV